MKEKTLVLGLLLLLLPTLLSAGSGPRIDFADREHDFGDVIHGQSPSAELTFSNAGDELLVIEKIESSCGCAKAIRGSRRVAPGAKSTLYAQIDTFGMQPGKHLKTIAVYCNDKEHPVTTVRLIFNVVRHVSITPDMVATSLPEPNMSSVFRVSATNHWTKAITLKAAATRGSDQVTMAPEQVVVPPGGKIDFRLSVRFEQQAGQRYKKGTALIETDDPLEKVLPVRYFIRLPQKGGS